MFATDLHVRVVEQAHAPVTTSLTIASVCSPGSSRSRALTYQVYSIARQYDLLQSGYSMRFLEADLDGPDARLVEEVPGRLGPLRVVDEEFLSRFTERLDGIDAPLVGMPVEYCARVKDGHDLTGGVHLPAACVVARLGFGIAVQGTVGGGAYMPAGGQRALVATLLISRSADGGQVTATVDVVNGGFAFAVQLAFDDVVTIYAMYGQLGSLLPPQVREVVDGAVALDAYVDSVAAFFYLNYGAANVVQESGDELSAAAARSGVGLGRRGRVAAGGGGENASHQVQLPPADAEWLELKEAWARARGRRGGGGGDFAEELQAALQQGHDGDGGAVNPLPRSVGERLGMLVQVQGAMGADALPTAEELAALGAEPTVAALRALRQRRAHARSGTAAQEGSWVVDDDIGEDGVLGGAALAASFQPHLVMTVRVTSRSPADDAARGLPPFEATDMTSGGSECVVYGAPHATLSCRFMAGAPNSSELYANVLAAMPTSRVEARALQTAIDTARSSSNGQPLVPSSPAAPSADGSVSNTWNTYVDGGYTGGRSWLRTEIVVWVNLGLLIALLCLGVLTLVAPGWLFCLLRGGRGAKVPMVPLSPTLLPAPPPAIGMTTMVPVVAGAFFTSRPPAVGPLVPPLVSPLGSSLVPSLVPPLVPLVGPSPTGRFPATTSRVQHTTWPIAAGPTGWRAAPDVEMVPTARLHDPAVPIGGVRATPHPSLGESAGVPPLCPVLVP